MKKSWDWLYHKESVNAKPEIFKGLGFGLADQRIFGQVISMRGFETLKTPDEVISPANLPEFLERMEEVWLLRHGENAILS